MTHHTASCHGPVGELQCSPEEHGLSSEPDQWWVRVYTPVTHSFSEHGPFPTKWLARRAKWGREYRIISFAWLEKRPAA